MSKKKKYKRSTQLSTKQIIITIITMVVIAVVSYIAEKIDLDRIINNITNYGNTSYSSLVEVPDYSGDLYVQLNENMPYFTEDEYTTTEFEKYSELDSLGRCGVAYANVCKNIMPPKGDERGEINTVRPTGWKQTKFNGEYLYNRCHLIAYSLSDEDANKQNLITGTRYFNVQGMLPFERLVLDYLNKNQNNHVLYRVTPVFKGENLLASGVEMEAYSVEDSGKLTFNVFVYNIQPGANINYTTGELINN